MSQGSEAAELLTKEAIQISEAAIKLSALGAKNLAALCIALANENQKLAGKTNMTRLLKEGKELRVFDVKESDLTQFAEAAKQYGVLFSVIKNGRDEFGNVDVLTRAEDVSKINRILEKMQYVAPAQDQPKEGDPAKKADSRAPQEQRSDGRGIGSRQETTVRNNPKSVRAKIISIKLSQDKNISAPSVQKGKER
ncbi:MAG: PcfB family protein [Clostridia bacterium]|nr:PcfB family protein [Clostridia bacterium]